MSNGPLASIIVITFNNEDTIEECLLSLFNQTYPFKEMVVVYDEGSSDGTEVILHMLSQPNNLRVKIVSTPHVGRSKARNIGWKNSTGEVLFFADADDVYCNNYLELAMHELSLNPKMGGVCLTGASLISNHSFVSGCFDIYSKIQQNRIKRGLFRPSWAWVYTRAAMGKVGGYDEYLDQAEDKDLFIRVEGCGYTIGLVTGINWFHRRPSSLRTYLKKNYIGGKRRLMFIQKYNRWGELFVHILPLWLSVGVLSLYLVNWMLPSAMLIGLGFFIMLRSVYIAKLVWRDIQEKQYIILYPFFELISYIFSALGHTIGLVSLPIKGGVG